MLPSSRTHVIFIIGVVCVAFGKCDGQLLDGADYVVDLHNKVRRYIGRQQIANMHKISWDPLLAVEAAAWATCRKLGFSKPEADYDDLGRATRGMNIAVGGENDTLSKFVRKWFTERKYYDEEFNMCQHGRHCGNYMQMVNAETRRIGCAMKPDCSLNGRRLKYFVCVYSPGIDWEQLYKRGSACSKCPESAPFCQAGLCVPCDRQNTSQCECRKTCHKRNVGHGKLNGKTCMCSCVYGRGPNCDEECINPEQYMDFDICSTIKPQACRSNDPAVKQMLKEFCPTKCACNPIPHKLRWF